MAEVSSSPLREVSFGAAAGARGRGDEYRGSASTLATPSRQRSESYTRGAALDLLSALRSLAAACRDGLVLRRGVTLRAGPYTLTNEQMLEIIRRRMERAVGADGGALPSYDDAADDSPNYLGEALVQDLVADALEDLHADRQVQWKDTLKMGGASASGKDARRQQMRLKYQLTQMRKDRDKILAVLSASKVSMAKYAAVKEGMSTANRMTAARTAETAPPALKDLPATTPRTVRFTSASSSTPRQMRGGSTDSKRIAWRPILTPSSIANRRTPRKADPSPSKDAARARAGSAAEAASLRAKLEAAESQRAADEKAVADTVRAVQMQAAELKRAAAFALERKDKDLSSALARAEAAEDELARERRLNAAQAEIASLRDRSDAAQYNFVLAQAQEDVAASKAEAGAYKSRCEAAEIEAAKLRDAIKASNAAQAEAAARPQMEDQSSVAALSGAVKEAQEKARAAEESASRLVRDAAKANARAESLERKLAAAREDIDRSNASRKRLENQLAATSEGRGFAEAEAQNAIREAQEKASFLEAALDKAHSDASAERSAMQQELEARAAVASAEAAAANDRADALEAAKLALEARLASAAAESAAANDRAATLEARFAESASKATAENSSVVSQLEERLRRFASSPQAGEPAGGKCD